MVCTSSEDGKDYIVGIHKGCFTESIASRICFFQSIGDWRLEIMRRTYKLQIMITYITKESGCP